MHISAPPLPSSWASDPSFRFQCNLQQWRRSHGHPATPSSPLHHLNSAPLLFSSPGRGLGGVRGQRFVRLQRGEEAVIACVALRLSRLRPVPHKLAKRPPHLPRRIKSEKWRATATSSINDAANGTGREMGNDKTLGRWWGRKWVVEGGEWLPEAGAL